MKKIPRQSWIVGCMAFVIAAACLAAGCTVFEHGEQVTNRTEADNNLEQVGVEVVLMDKESDVIDSMALNKNEAIVMKGLYAGRASEGRSRSDLRTQNKDRDFFRAGSVRHIASKSPAALPARSFCEIPAPPVFHTEEYDRIYENGYKEVTQHPLSTFSIDVDTASYANTRRFLNDQQLPPKDAVRIEELINYFTYSYPEPEGNEPVSISTEIAACPWNPEHQLALVGLQARSIETEKLPPNNLTFLLDVSGSMNAPDKLPLLKTAMKLLVDQMRPEDQVAIVVYAGAAGLVLDSTPGTEKEKIMAAIERLNAGGSTAGGAGIQLAYQTAKVNYLLEGNNRVILATDGDFNVGISSNGELVRMIEEKRDQGIFLTVLGFGTGNYKDSKMEQLADKGNGNYAYIDDVLEARKALVHEMGSTLVAVAKDVKLQIEFNPGAVKGYRLIGYENRVLAKEDFNNDKKDAGEMGASHSVTALYELIPAGSEEAVPGVDPLKYQQAKPVKSDELMTVKLRYKEPLANTSQLMSRVVKADERVEKSSPNFLFASSVAEFGMLLRDSEHKGQASYESILARARQAVGSDEHGYRAEFVRLVDKAKLLSI